MGVKYMKKRELECGSDVRVVTSNNFIRAAGLENISLKARKLLYLAMAQSRKTDEEFYEFTISIKTFSELMDIHPSNVYDTADEITDELMHGFINCSKNKKEFEKFHLFRICTYQEGKGITFRISEEITPILLNLQRDFSQPLLNEFMRMRSNYSIQIWHFFQMKMKRKDGPGISSPIVFTASVEELRAVTGTQNKLHQIGQFKERVLEQAIREIYENCAVRVSYTQIKKGRTVVAFEFTVKSLIDEPMMTPELINRARKAELIGRMNTLKQEEKEELQRLSADY